MHFKSVKFFTFADTHNNFGTLYLSTTITPSHFFLSLLGQSLTTAHNQNLAIISSISLHNCSFNTSICKRSWTWTRISFAIDIPKVHSVRFGILPACLLARPSWSYWSTRQLFRRPCSSPTVSGERELLACLKDNNVCVSDLERRDWCLSCLASTLSRPVDSNSTTSSSLRLQKRAGE